MTTEHKLTCKHMSKINFFTDDICFVFWDFNNMEAVTLSIFNPAQKFKISVFMFVPCITVILAKHCIKLPDDGSFVIRNMLEKF